MLVHRIHIGRGEHLAFAACHLQKLHVAVLLVRCICISTNRIPHACITCRVYSRAVSITHFKMRVRAEAVPGVAHRAKRRASLYPLPGPYTQAARRQMAVVIFAPVVAVDAHIIAPLPRQAARAFGYDARKAHRAARDGVHRPVVVTHKVNAVVARAGRQPKAGGYTVAPLENHHVFILLYSPSAASWRSTNVSCSSVATRCTSSTGSPVA